MRSVYLLTLFIIAFVTGCGGSGGSSSPKPVTTGGTVKSGILDLALDWGIEIAGVMIEDARSDQSFAVVQISGPPGKPGKEVCVVEYYWVRENKTDVAWLQPSERVKIPIQQGVNRLPYYQVPIGMNVEFRARILSKEGDTNQDPEFQKFSAGKLKVEPGKNVPAKDLSEAATKLMIIDVGGGRYSLSLALIG